MIKLENFGIVRKEGELNNGIRFVTFEKDSLPINIAVLFQSGSRYDPLGKEGLSHFAEHMITSGSINYPSKDKLAVFIENIGGIFGASTSAEVMTVNVAVADEEDLPHAVNLINEIVEKSLFSEETVENERKAILKELGDKKSNPENYLWEVYRKVFFQDLDIGRSTLGSEDTIKAITKTDLLNFYHNMLTANRMTIVAGGGIKNDKAAKIFNKLLTVKNKKDQKLTANNSDSSSDHKNLMIQKYPGIDQIHITLGFRAVDEFSPEAVGLEVIGTISGGGRASMLAKKLRYERGLVYGVGAMYHGGADYGSWFVNTSTSKDNLQETVDIITQEFERIYKGNITQEELDFAKNKIVKSKKREMQTAGSWVGFHAFGEVFAPGNYLKLDDYLNEIDKLTLEDLRNVGKKYFVPSKWYMAMCGDINEDYIRINY